MSYPATDSDLGVSREVICSAVTFTTWPQGYLHFIEGKTSHTASGWWAESRLWEQHLLKGCVPAWAATGDAGNRSPGAPQPAMGNFKQIRGCPACPGLMLMPNFPRPSFPSARQDSLSIPRMLAMGWGKGKAPQLWESQGLKAGQPSLHVTGPQRLLRDPHLLLLYIAVMSHAGQEVVDPQASTSGKN